MFIYVYMVFIDVYICLYGVYRCLYMFIWCLYSVVMCYYHVISTEICAPMSGAQSPRVSSPCSRHRDTATAFQQWRGLWAWHCCGRAKTC